MDIHDLPQPLFLIFIYLCVQTVTTMHFSFIDRVCFSLNQNWPFSWWCDAVPRISKD